MGNLAVKLVEQAPQEPVLSATHCSMMLRRRVFAATLDFFIVQGFTLYFAPLISYGFLLSFEREFHRLNGAAAAHLFAQSLQFGFYWVWLGGSILLWGAYTIGSFSFFGKSLGSALLGLRLVTSQGAVPSLGAIGLRLFFFSCSWALLGIPFLILFRLQELKCWHDHASGTSFELTE